MNGIHTLKLCFGRPPEDFLEKETNSQEGTSGSFKEYYELLRKRFAYFQKMVKNIG